MHLLQSGAGIANDILVFYNVHYVIVYAISYGIASSIHLWVMVLHSFDSFSSPYSFCIAS